MQKQKIKIKVRKNSETPKTNKKLQLKAEKTPKTNKKLQLKAEKTQKQTKYCN
jgi:hypothetical protein